MHELRGRVAAITGGGSGIGRATALALADRGCHVAVLDISEVGAEETATLVRQRGVDASVHVVDVRDRDAVQAAAGEVARRHGGCAVLVNNAGVTTAGSFEQGPEEDLAWIVGINVWGVVHGCRAFLPLLRQADEAHIVNLSSMVGLVGLPHNATYSLTKGAVRSFSESLRAELITSSIGVTAVFPGAVHTAIATSARGSHAHLLDRMGRSRLAPVAQTSPRAVAKAIVRAIERDRARVVVGPDAHLVSALSRVLPGRSGLVGRATNRFVS